MATSLHDLDLCALELLEFPMAIDARILPVVISLLVVLAIGAAIAVVFQPFGLGGDSGAAAESCEWNTTWQQNGETYHDEDCDRIANAVENRRGLDPHDADSDDDGLDDGAELYIVRTDPHDPDTDGDGVLDSEEDPDGDGLTNAEEVEAGSHYDLVDGDRDGLTDPQEIANGTEPLLADTDDDGVEDLPELQRGTDPTDPDSDDDGVRDGNETVTQTFEAQGSDASVTVRGPARVSLEIETRNDGRSENSVAEGPVIRVEQDHDGDFERATVRIPIHSTETAGLAVHHWDGTQSGRWSPLDSRIEDGYAVAEVHEFGYFTVVDPGVWGGG